jgi:hypothetical protein
MDPASRETVRASRSRDSDALECDLSGEKQRLGSKLSYSALMINYDVSSCLTAVVGSSLQRL